MQRILFIIPSLEYSGAAKQLTLLAERLPGEHFQRRVCVLARTGPWAERLRAAGVIVDVLGPQRLMDFRHLGTLWNLLRAYRADVLHAWCPSAVRALALTGGLARRHGRLVISAPLLPRRPGVSLPWWDRWLLRRADRVTVGDPLQADECRRFGIGTDRLVEIPPGVETAADGDGPAESARLIAGVGPLERHKGFRDAVWALDILRYLYHDLRLLLVGCGPDQPWIERFARTANVRDRLDLAGDPGNVPAVLAGAQLLWAPAHAPAGVNAVLEAMATGRPVVASRLPGLEHLVVDRETGFLVPPGDKAVLARQTRVLLDDADLRRRMGQAARRRAAECFAVETMVGRFIDLYQKTG
jgi:glycosyltransferase involved in cell wall biosynthesis